MDHNRGNKAQIRLCLKTFQNCFCPFLNLLIFALLANDKESGVQHSSHQYLSSDRILSNFSRVFSKSIFPASMPTRSSSRGTTLRIMPEPQSSTIIFMPSSMPYFRLRAMGTVTCPLRVTNTSMVQPQTQVLQNPLVQLNSFGSKQNKFLVFNRESISRI